MSNLCPSIKEALNQLGNTFEPNDLAYLSLTSKNEHLLCASLASRLHAQFADQPDLLVAREWRAAPKCPVDLAILSHGEPRVLIEAKAGYTFDLVGYESKRKRYFPSDAIQKDLAKLARLNFECERYVLVFFTHPHQIPSAQFAGAVKYIDLMRRRGTPCRDEISQCFDLFHASIGNLPIMAQGELRAGRAFDVDVSVLYWLFDAGLVTTNMRQ